MAWDAQENAVVRRARMFLASPDAVYQELRDYASQTTRYSGGDSELELHLMSRGDPLVNLALAEFGSSQDVVLSLYKAACDGRSGDEFYDRGVRMAVISNRKAEGVLTGLFGMDATPLAGDVLLRKDENELKAMVTNPLHRGLLVKLYMGKPPFDALSMQGRSFLIGYSADNPALNTDDSNEHGPDLTAWDIQKAIWGMLRVTPVDELAARALHELLLKMDPRRAHIPESIEEIEATLTRWAALKTRGFNEGEEREGDLVEELTYSQELCVLIAAHFGRAFVNKRVVHYGDPGSDDLSKRAAHYGRGTMKPEEMEAAHDRDGQAFVLAALFNDDLYLSSKCRAVLERVVGDYTRWVYKARCQQIAGRVKWFQVEPVTEEMAQEERAAPPVAEAAHVQALAKQVARVESAISKLTTYVVWGFILLAGAVFFA